MFRMTNVEKLKREEYNMFSSLMLEKKSFDLDL
jgi:hypothetical protein